MSDRNRARLPGRAILLLLTLYAIAMIGPDLLRLVRPLGSFGLAVDGDGRIYDVQGPFESEADSPAWRAGLRAGDRLDLAAMSCVSLDTVGCASLLSQWGGVTYVMPGREATLTVAPAPGRSGREVKLTAGPRPSNRLLDAVVALDTLAGVLVILGAAWLVWTRAGPMTWGFFIYVIQFNPGQAFEFWAWLQLWPRALLAQNVIFLVMQAVAYAGLLLFALRAPVDRTGERWRPVERALPALAIVFLGVALLSIGTLFGYPAEIWARGMLFIGFAVSLGALAILVGRRRDLSPRDYQRIRWVIWGCLIGLPAYLLAQLGQQTSLFDRFIASGQAAEEATGALFLINGVLCLFVVEAVRRQTVVNVWIPLRRATAFGLLLSVPALFLHKQIEMIDEYIHMPDWAWVVVASGLVYLIARGHEFATDLIDRLFDREFIRAERHLAAVGETIQNSA
ncbi:MAG TPA: PDZ domain-containing protein, partial [Roseiarcus sp.]|nr:PDZ domain-containing protein [Roseiarcus sp.]